MSEERPPYNIGQSDLSYKDEDLLSLVEVAKQSGWDYEKLRSYLRDCPQLNTYVKAGKKKGSKGLGYPPDSIPVFEKLLDDVNAGKVVPTTLAGWLSDLSQEPNGESVLLALRAPVTAGTGEYARLTVELLKRLAEAIERQEQRVLQAAPVSVPDDALLTAEQAAVLLACKPEQVSRYVKGVKGRRGVWKRSAILEFIGRQEQKT